MQNTLELGHSCLMVAIHETSFALRGATYGMQNKLELPHSCLIVARHEASFRLRTNLWDTATSPNTAPATKNEKLR